MTYAHINNGTIDAVSLLPKGADVDGQWLTLTDVNAHLAGWLPVTDTPRPADTPTTTYDRSVELVDGAPKVVWTERPQTQAELTAQTAVANRGQLDTAITNALAELQAIIDAPAVPTVPAGTLTAAQLSTALRSMRDAVQANRAATQRISRTLRHAIRLLRNDLGGTD